jgi:aspartyl/glutamyl-tRNA(Asn/Gln) amidotransferase C subunit
MSRERAKVEPGEVTEEVFRHLVDLAALELSPEEADYLLAEMNSQLRVIAELASIALPEGTPIASHGIPYPAPIRPDLRLDESHESAEADEILRQAPEKDGRYIVVPDLPVIELE